jgi:disulfide oxidoreductase YuzD
MAKKKKQAEWLLDVEEHDYPAAESYLCILHPVEEAKELVAKLKEAPMMKFKAKDLFRASQLSLLGISNSHVQRNIDKIRKGKKMSPLLVVRDTKHGKLVIADGYHRMCAMYHFDEDSLVPCKIV